MKNTHIWGNLSLILKGTVVGFGAIMPGISGGTLCVAFGMYHILLDVLSSPRQTIKKHGWKIICFLAGFAIGFFALAGLAGWLLEVNAQAVTCVFIGFILGTLPDLWHSAGQAGRGRSSYIAFVAGFFFMLSALLLLRHGNVFVMAPNFGGFLFCGLVWGISFIVPGLSSSTLLLFFGLYQPMLEGISRLSGTVLFPLAVGMIVCLVVLPKSVKYLYRKWYAIVSHIVLGIVIASTVSIIPEGIISSGIDLMIAIMCICGGGFASYYAGKACSKLE